MRGLNLALAVLAATLSMVAILRAGIEEITEKLGGSGSLAADHRVREYVEAHLDEDLSLTTLAGIGRFRAALERAGEVGI